MADPVIETPLASGATDRGGPGGIPPSPSSAPAPARPASDAAMVAQDVANKYPNAAPASLTSGTPQIPGAPPAAAPAAPAAAPQQTPHEALYSKALKALSPPTRYIDAQGNQQVAPPSLGNSIVAGVIAGMMHPTQYRQGEFGPIADTQATAAGAFQSGEAKSKEQSADQQKLSDDMQARKINAVKSNADTVHLHAATMGYEADMGKLIQGQVDTDAPLAKIATDHDQNLQPGDTKAVWGKNVTMADALKHPEWGAALTKHTLIHDGSIEVDDGHGNMIPTPTYTIVDPNIKASMTQEAVDMASQINPQWKTAFEASGGSMRMQLGQLKTVNDQISSVKFAEQIFQDAASSDDPKLQALGLKGNIKGELMSAVRNGVQGSQQALQALAAMENAKAANGTTADALNRLINDPETAAGRQYVLKALGITADKAQAYINGVKYENEKKDAVAKAGGNPAKLPAAQGQIQKLTDSLAPNEYITPADSAALNADVPVADEEGNINMNQAQISAITQKRDAIVAKARTDAINSGNPDEIAKTVNLEVGSGDLTGVKDLYPGNRSVAARTKFNLQSAAMASSIGLNPTHYTIETMKEKAAKDESYKDTSKPSSVGSSIASYQTFLEHNAEAVSASNEWKRTNSEFWNKPLNELEQKFGNDPSFIKFKASLEPPSKEFMSFLNAGRAEQKADGEAMEGILDPKSSPMRINAALQQLAKSADARAASLGDSYVGVVGTTFPRLMNENSLNVLRQLGVESKAAAFNGVLPRNPSFSTNPSVSTLAPITDRAMAKQFFAASGNNPQRATEIAREHGWVLSIK